MHGVPAGLDLSFLHGATLLQVCLGVSQLQFHFHPAGSISVEGEWELAGPTGQVIDRHDPSPDRPPYQFHHLLGRGVVEIKVSPPTSVELTFEGGVTLRLFDSSEDYESFTILPSGIVV